MLWSIFSFVSGLRAQSELCKRQKRIARKNGEFLHAIRTGGTSLSSSASLVRGFADVTVSRAFLTTLRSNMTHIASLSTNTFHLALTSVPGCSKMPPQLKIIFFNTLLRLIRRFCFYARLLFMLYLFHYSNLLISELSVPTPSLIESEVFGVGTMFLLAFMYKWP